MEKVPYLDTTLTRWQVGNSTFLAMPERGARLMHWHVTFGDGTVRDVVYWPDLATTDEMYKVRGGNPILFPFCGRTFDQGEIYHWRTPDGQRRPMPMHGIARQGDFKVHADPRGFTAQFIPGDEARAAYPFDYEFTVAYRFEPLALTCEFMLRNLDRQPLPWCPGHHFYFTVPWHDGGKRSDYAIRIPATRTYKQDMTKGPLLPGPALQQQESLGNVALVDTQHAGLKSNLITFGPVGHPGEVSVRIGTDKVPHPDATVVTWTLDDKAPFYCVEPWMGPPNAPENKVGLQWVAPGQTQSFVVQIQVK